MEFLSSTQTTFLNLKTKHTMVFL